MTQYEPTWTSSHVYGQGLLNRYRGLYYCQIPKCASMWMRAYLRQNNHPSRLRRDSWETCDANTPGIGSMTPVIMLRDPMARWISACPANNKITDTQHDLRRCMQIFDNLDSWLYDEHTARQWDFIRWLDLDRAIFFLCDTDLSLNVNDFFTQQNFSMSIPPAINQQSSKIKPAAEAWRNLLNIPKFADRFRHVYRQDYELLQSVNFYQPSKELT